MADNNKEAELVEEKQALTQFFSSLLTDTDDLPVAELNTRTVSENREYKSDADNNSSTVFLPVIPINVEDEKITKTVSETVVPEVESTNIIEQKINSIKSDSRDVDELFQIMMFKTAGLTLAVPLVELSGVITWPENITEMPGHKDSYLGIVQHLGRKIPIIDIAQIVFPKDKIDSIINSESKDRLKRIVFINDFEWGLACDAVNDVITIESNQIKWRKKGIKRAWLAGTVVEHMCALLDTQELSILLNSDHS